MAKKKTALGANTSKATAEEIVRASMSDAPTKEDKPVRINVSVPADLHHRFKVKAVKDGKSHQQILIEAIQRYVEQ